MYTSYEPAYEIECIYKMLYNNLIGCID